MLGTKLQRRFGSIIATAFFAVVCILVSLEETQKYVDVGISVGFTSTTVRTSMPRQLTIAEGLDLNEEGQTLIQSNKGKCEEDACKAPGGEPIPKTVWLLWNNGFRNSPDYVKRPHHSWILYNPTWTVRGLNLQEAEHLTKVREEGTDGYLPDDVWDSMAIQAKSDYIRISLLRNYGGVWADASLQCNEPLDSWVDLDRDYLFFLRDEQEPDNYWSLYPWYSSWWMAASKNSHAAELIFTNVVDFLRNEGKSEREYFWFHRIIANLWNTDESFVASIGPSESATGPHCLLGTESFVDQHMFKRCARGIVKDPFNLKDEEDWKMSQKKVEPPMLEMAEEESANSRGNVGPPPMIVETKEKSTENAEPPVTVNEKSEENVELEPQREPLLLEQTENKAPEDESQEEVKSLEAANKEFQGNDELSFAEKK